jgi:hypothetical protein
LEILTLAQRFVDVITNLTFDPCSKRRLLLYKSWISPVLIEPEDLSYFHEKDDSITVFFRCQTDDPISFMSFPPDIRLAASERTVAKERIW